MGVNYSSAGETAGPVAHVLYRRWETMALASKKSTTLSRHGLSPLARLSRMLLLIVDVQLLAAPSR